MIVMRRWLLLAVAIVAASCGDAPLALANIQTGRSLNQDGSIASISQAPCTVLTALSSRASAAIRSTGISLG